MRAADGRWSPYPRDFRHVRATAGPPHPEACRSTPRAIASRKVSGQRLWRSTWTPNTPTDEQGSRPGPSSWPRWP